MRTGSIPHRTDAIDCAACHVDTSTGDTGSSAHVIGVDTGAVVRTTPASITHTGLSAKGFSRNSEIARDR